MNRLEIGMKLSISQEKAHKYIKNYIEGGFEAVVKRDKRSRPTLLDATQTAAFRETILHSSLNRLVYQAIFGQET